MLRIKVFSDEGRLVEEITPVDGMILGRSMSADVGIVGKAVSRKHARLRVCDGKCYIVDLGSHNGTFIEEVRLEPERAYELRPGNRVCIANWRLEVTDGSGVCVPATVPEETTDLQNISDLVSLLSRHQRYFIRNVTDSPGRGRLRPILQHYVQVYSMTPLEIIRKQNQFISSQNCTAGLEGKLTGELIQLNARTERLIYEGHGGLNVSSATFDEKGNVGFIVEGSIFPGHNFKIDDPSTWNRELLMVHKYHSETEESLKAAKEIGVRESTSISNGDVERAALAIMNTHMRVYSPQQDREVDEGAINTLGEFQVNGGCCRHRSATLQLMLQEAGITSRYVRGCVAGSGYHAWVEVDIHNDGSYSLILDPNLGLAGLKSEVCREQNELLYGYSRITIIEYGWARAKDVVYIVDQGRFNTVWQPKQRMNVR